ncbi:MAG TPA: alpha-glucan family phosphorylase [Solirubrobacteraceae bacterium]|nr:alpha-glucan family phosphorylase [Solirubrobacteraceae bacterium]
MTPGQQDVARAAADLAARIPDPLAPLARVAYDYRWSWAPGGDELFAAIDPNRWERCGHNPVRLLEEASHAALERAAGDGSLIERAAALEGVMRADAERPAAGAAGITAEHPVAFVCAEFGVHRSLPIYSGGLGVLAGDILKQASDDAFPLIGVGLMYHQGYFRQRVDALGRQHEYWVPTDPERLPAALVTGDDGQALTVSLPVDEDELVAQIWRVDVGRVPLFLLDADRPENSQVVRWTSGRLYIGDPQTRLAQYALLGVGAVRALAALGIEPGVVHLNEGHGALAALELAKEQIGAGVDLDDALEEARRLVVFTTHTPVPAGNDAYPPATALGALGGYAHEIGLEDEDLVRLGRTDPADPDEDFGITQLALRTSRAANAVSRRHGAVARQMWRGLWPGRAVDGVPITHVTNGVHLPTWVGPEMRELFDRHLGPEWTTRSADPEVWAPLADVPAEELWDVRQRQRAVLVDELRERSVADRLGRGEDRDYAQAAARVFDPEALTIGFARRLATYKRLDLLVADPARALRLINGRRRVQIVLAGKAHPKDEAGKQLVERLFSNRAVGDPGARVVFLDDYDMGLAARLVQGCDVWLNLPRPPLEASGTSGMKSAVNGGLQLSVLDGWWAEGFDPERGWALSGDIDEDHEAADAAVAAELFRVLEEEAVPAFYDRFDDGLPHAWLAKVRASVQALAGEFSAARMLADYERKVYAPLP